MHNEGENIYKTIKDIHKNSSGEDYEIIVVDDGSTDRNYNNLTELGAEFYRIRRAGPARGRNYGAKHAKGKFFVFLDAHMNMCPNWLPDFFDVIDTHNDCIITPAMFDVNSPGPVGYGYTFASWSMNVKWLPKTGEKPYGVPIAPGACLILSRKTFYDIGGFDFGLRGWGREDLEMSLRSWLMGYRVLIVPKIKIGHLFRRTFPYKINNTLIVRNTLRVAFSHFKWDRVKKVVNSLKKYPNFYRGYASILFSDTLLRRRALMKKRKFDDDWFFRRFSEKGIII